jgi:hypothetical protein
MATGVPVVMIKKAWELKESGYGGLQPTRRPIAEQPAPVPVPNPNYNPKAKAANERKRAKKEPVPGMRLCSGTCKELKPKSKFNIKNKRTGSCLRGASHASGTISANGG